MSDLLPVGVLGGTFDPLHFGHLRLAEEAREALALEQVCFVPAGDPPHRARPTVAPEQRLHMVRQAIADNAGFTVDDSEILASGKSYTVLTLERLRVRFGEKRPLVLILGADAFAGLPEWHEWQRLLTLAHIAVANRPGFTLQVQDLTSGPLREVCEDCLCHSVTELAASAAGRIAAFEMAPLAISASLIRSFLRMGKSIRYLLPASVLDYIEENRLYR